MINLPVPYKSQWDDDARKTNNDCGPASIAMILNYFGENYTTDQIFQKTGAGQGLINIGQIQKAISACGYESTFQANLSVDNLRRILDQKVPVIALVHYGSLNSTQDKNFKGGHFFVVVGYKEDGYFVNDPNFKDNFRQDGDHHFYTKTEFEKAWKDSKIDGNPINSIIYIQPKNPVENDDPLVCDKKSVRDMLVGKATKFDEQKPPYEEIKKENGEIKLDLESTKTTLEEYRQNQQEVANKLGVKNDIADIKGAIEPLLTLEEQKRKLESKLLELEDDLKTADEDIKKLVEEKTTLKNEKKELELELTKAESKKLNEFSKLTLFFALINKFTK